jgi:acetolactate synthase-1/2/3 large subunit
MNLQELGTIAQYSLPIKIIIINNRWQGMVRQWQESFYGERYSHSNMEKGSPNFSLIANSYGIKSIKIEKITLLKEKLEQLLKSKGASLIDVIVKDNENCYPMVAPGKNNSQMLGLFKRNLNTKKS